MLQNLSYFSSLYSHAVFDNSRSKGEKLIIKANHFCCEIKGGGQQMAAMMLMLINFNNGCVHCYSLLALTSLQSFVGRHL